MVASLWCVLAVSLDDLVANLIDASPLSVHGARHQRDVLAHGAFFSVIVSEAIKVASVALVGASTEAGELREDFGNVLSRLIGFARSSLIGCRIECRDELRAVCPAV